MGILDDDVARVREATDLVALVSEHVGLKHVGRRFQGLCPFHTEKTPSFSVSPDKGVFYCFGCQKSGDAITFVREVEHLDFVGAVERLAARANIALRYDDANLSQERKRKQRLHEVVQAAIDFYHRRLLEHDHAGSARRYLRGRGFDGDAVRRFVLGYSPDGFDVLSDELQHRRFARQDIIDAGLAFVNKVNKLQDSFRGRLMFPIWDTRGDPVGFGGRMLDADQRPKYKNTAETSIYQKSRLLYGLHWAKGEIVAQGEVVICEGYTDVMAFTLAGVPTAVATCGTALADDHFLMLKNLARKITLAYDADAAGQAATERCYQWEQRFEVQFQVADLPAGRDPADVFRDDPAQLVAAVKGASPFLEFRVERLLREEHVTTLEDRARVAQHAAAMIAEHPNDLVRDQYAMKLSSRLDIDADRLRATLDRARSRPHARRAEKAPHPDVARNVDRRELDALRWAVHTPELMSGRLDSVLFADPLARTAFDALTSWPWHEALERVTPDIAALLQRCAVDDPESGSGIAAEELAARVVVNLVEASSQRLLTSMLKRDDPRSADVKAALDVLANARSSEHWSDAENAASQLVTWIADDGDD